MIYSKLDWYTVVLYSTDIFSVLDKLEIKHDYFEEFLESGYERSQGFSSVFVWYCNNINIEVKFDDYLSTDADSLFTTKFSKVRLDISGKGLDYLRSRKFDVDTHFTDHTFWGERGTDYKITRSDFAFDFVNYQGEFLDNFLNWIKERERDGVISAKNARLFVGRPSGIQYSYRCGDQKTLYLGSTRGDKLVRIYDKLLEQSKNGVLMNKLPKSFTENEPDGNVDSWFRIEFQTRRKCADDYLFGIDHDLSRVLRVMFEEYRVREKDGTALPFIEKLYKWDDLPPIRKMFDFVQSPVKVLDSAAACITGRGFKSIFTFIARYGIDQFIELVNERAKSIFRIDTATCAFTERSLRNNISNMLEDEGITLDDLPGLVRHGNEFYLKERPTNKAIGESFGMFGEQYFHFCSALLRKDYKKAYEILTISESDNTIIIQKLLSLML